MSAAASLENPDKFFVLLNIGKQIGVERIEFMLRDVWTLQSKSLIKSTCFWCSLHRKEQEGGDQD